MTSEKPLEVKISEKYYIEKGQGIEQLLAVSLDDHIRLHEFPSFVQLKGELILEGEFAKENRPAEIGERQQYPQRKYMQSIEEIEDGVTYFRQVIPVDITIPKSSVSHIDDIRVAINDFDYSIPTPHIFILFARLSIKGIVKEEREPVQVEKELLDEEVDSLEEELPLVAEEIEVEEVAEDEEREDDWVPLQIEEEEVILAVDEEEIVDELVDEAVDSTFSEVEVEESEEGEAHSFLDELFGGEDVASLTKYIVQEDDSLVSIAERFGLSLGELARHNRHVEEDLQQGMVLTIYH